MSRARHVSTRPANDYEQYEGNNHAEHAATMSAVASVRFNNSSSIATEVHCPGD
jgi:hypothetical protein